MGPEFQEVFNLNKGSIPVRLDMKLDKFDECAKQSSAGLRRQRQERRAGAVDRPRDGGAVGRRGRDEGRRHAVLERRQDDRRSRRWTSWRPPRRRSDMLTRGAAPTAPAPTARRDAELARGGAACTAAAMRSQRPRSPPCLRHAPRALAAQARAGAVVRARVPVHLRLHRLERLPVALGRRACCRTTSSSASSSTSRCSRASAGRVALTNLAIFGSLFIGGAHGASACCWRSCSTRRSAPRACCARSTSIRWRCRSSSPARPGSGSSIPGLGLEQLVRAVGLRELHLRLADQPRHGDLHASSSPASGRAPAS